jgi:hypothetical protein
MHGRHSGTLRRHCGAAASFLATATPPKDCKLQRCASLDLVSLPIQGTRALMVMETATVSAAFPVGILGMDFLSRFDIEPDVTKGKFNLYSQDHCPGQVVYWSDTYASSRAKPHIYIATKESILYFTSADARK